MVMNIELKEKPKNPIIIEGFPGFGFVSTIVTEYLIKHLDAKPIGKITHSKLTPIAILHKSKIIYPVEIFYAKKTNLVIVQAVTPVEGLEWEIADTIIKLAEDLKAKEIISIEGVASTGEVKTPSVYFHTNTEGKKKVFEDIKIKQMQEGIIIGVTGALLMKVKDYPFSCFFVETASKLPDNKAAGRIIEILDKYLGLTIDYKPLIEKAKEVEGKLKELLTQLSHTKTQKDKKHLSYMG